MRQMSTGDYTPAGCTLFCMHMHCDAPGVGGAVGAVREADLGERRATAAVCTCGGGVEGADAWVSGRPDGPYL